MRNVLVTVRAPSAMLRLMLLLAMLLAVTACSHAGATAADAVHVNGLDVARSITLCKTTEADLRRILGTPTRDGILHERRIVSWIVSEGSAVHYLAVLLDSRGTVVDLYWDIPTEVPWVPADQCSTR